MPYVERDEAGAIKGVYANLQPGYAEEWLEYAELRRPTEFDGLPVILTSMALRLDTLEAGRPVPVDTPILFDPQPVEDEDPGEQPEIFTEEDVAGLAPIAVSEEAASEPELAAPDSEPAASPTDHGGMLIQPPDEIYALRDYVRARISEAKLIRLDAAVDPSRRDYLASCWQDRVSLGALGQPVSDQIEQAAQEFMALERREAAINAHAATLERAAGLAEKPALHAMAADVWAGGPT